MTRPVCTVAIVGCGISGLAAAIGISRAGHKVTIFEQAVALSEVGAGIQIPCNATRIFGRWDILGAVESQCLRPSTIILKGYRDGTILSTQNLVPYAEDTYGAPYLLAHRADFVRILADEALRLGVTIRFGSAVTGLDAVAPSIFLRNGVEHRADVILGADGLSSTCRTALLGHLHAPVSTGDMAYRFTIKIDDIVQQEDLCDLLDGFPVICWMGPNAHALCYQLKQDRLCNLVLLCQDNIKEVANVSKADVQEIKERFINWDPKLRKLIDMAAGALQWRLQITKPLDTWSHPSGQFTLLGDACHSTLPYLAQGAAQAVEDGAALGALFENLENTNQLPHLMRVFEKVRKPRTTRIMNDSTSMRNIFNLPDGDLQRERDRQLTNMQPSLGCPNRWADPDFQRWLLGYDAQADVLKQWQMHQRRYYS